MRYPWSKVPNDRYGQLVKLSVMARAHMMLLEGYCGLKGESLVTDAEIAAQANIGGNDNCAEELIEKGFLRREGDQLVLVHWIEVNDKYREKHNHQKARSRRNTASWRQRKRSSQPQESDSNDIKCDRSPGGHQPGHLLNGYGTNPPGFVTYVATYEGDRTSAEAPPAPSQDDPDEPLVQKDETPNGSVAGDGRAPEDSPCVPHGHVIVDDVNAPSPCHQAELVGRTRGNDTTGYFREYSCSECGGYVGTYVPKLSQPLPSLPSVPKPEETADALAAPTENCYASDEVPYEDSEDYYDIEEDAKCKWS